MNFIYLDFKRAFDKVPHKKLIWKLESTRGLEGRIKEWIKDHLDGKEMWTIVRDEKSQMEEGN